MENSIGKGQSRRTFIKASASTLGGMALGVGADSQQTSSPETAAGRRRGDQVVRKQPAHRPNVVLIISDEHQYRTLGCYSSVNRTATGESPTPNIDKLAAEGILFDNAYTASPLCAPARAALMTGTYPHINTALRHKYHDGPPGTYRFPGILPTLMTIGEAFRRGGYATAAIGKMHVHGEVKGINDLGFDYANLRFYTYYPNSQYADYAGGDWNCRYREIKPYAQMTYREIDSSRFADAPPGLTPRNNPRNEHLMETLVEKQDQVFDDLVAQDAVAYIDRSISQHKPFFLYVGFEKPHEPWSTHKEFLEMFPPDSMHLPNSWDEVDKKGRYPFLMNWLTVAHPEESKAKNTLAAYHACIREMDTQVGKVVQKCKDLGIYKNTIFVYTSDHGDSMYTHSLYEKHCMFEMSVKVPLIVSYAKALPEGKRCSALVSLLDLPPLLLTMTSNPVPDSYKGVSLLHSLEGKASSERMVFSEFYEAGKGAYKMFPEAESIPMRMCRYKTYKYIYTHGFIEQLYDLKSDPDEMNNLVLTAPQECRGVLEKLRLTTMNDWTIDDNPLFDVYMERNGNSIEFHWTSLPGIQEFILYRGVSTDPLEAREVARSKGGKVVDAAGSATSTLNYWVVAVPKLERTTDNSEVYKDTPVATAQLALNLPASVRMEVRPEDRKKAFYCMKQSVYV